MDLKKSAFSLFLTPMFFIGDVLYRQFPPASLKIRVIREELALNKVKAPWIALFYPIFAPIGAD